MYYPCFLLRIFMFSPGLLWLCLVILCFYPCFDFFIARLTYMHTYILMWLRGVTSKEYKTTAQWVTKVKIAGNMFYIKPRVKSSVFKWRLKLVIEDSIVTLDGRLFQTRDAAAAKERSSMVERRVEGTTCEFVIADCLVLRRRLSIRYAGAWPCR